MAIYRMVFGGKRFYKFNKALYLCSLRGLGVMNFENGRVSGELIFLKNLLKGRKDGVVLDVGANIGNYSNEVLQINPCLKIYAFEPHLQTFATLMSNIQHPNFTAVNVAVGSDAGVANLFDYAEADGSSHASLFRDVIERLHMAQSTHQKVNVVTLFDFVSRSGIVDIALLKIDVEGNELNVLKGARTLLLEGRIKAIHFEFNEMNVVSGVNFKSFWDILSNYDIYRMLPDGLVKIEKYNPLFCEIYAYQNFVALLKTS